MLMVGVIPGRMTVARRMIMITNGTKSAADGRGLDLAVAGLLLRALVLKEKAGTDTML
jgi:hypothetical protein